MTNTYNFIGISHDDRLAEMGKILAAGLIRMKTCKSSSLSANGRESSVDFMPPKSGHGNRNSGGTTR